MTLWIARRIESGVNGLPRVGTLVCSRNSRIPGLSEPPVTKMIRWESRSPVPCLALLARDPREGPGADDAGEPVLALVLRIAGRVAVPQS